MANKNLTYRDAGVDIDAGNALVERIKPIVAATRRPEVMSGIGGFGGLFALPPGRYREPVLVSGTDGVGTKLKLAQQLGIHDTIGIDLVAMCVNDVLVQGAEPLFFLDYFACGKLNVEVAEDVVKGIATGCSQAGAALIGGETAEMPDMYGDGDYDLAGFCVGAVEKSKILTGQSVKPGDVVLGLASSGVHSNGFSLVRKILFEDLGLSVDDTVEELGCTVGEELIKPTKIYVRSVLGVLSHYSIHSLVHNTGGGFIDNIPRVLPKGCRAVIDKESWEEPPIFTLLQEKGEVPEAEMYRTFNMGIGMMAVVKDTDAHIKGPVHFRLRHLSFFLERCLRRKCTGPLIWASG